MAMFGRRNVTRDIWRAVVVAGAMLGTSACSSAQKEPAAQPTAVEPEATPAGTEPAEPVAEAEPVQAAASQPAAPVIVDAGIPDAAPPPEAAPAKKRPRGSGKKPSGRGFVFA
jgi:hypothetical protein